MVYSDPKLAWAAGAPAAPVSIKVANFSGCKGMIVLLDEEGNLSVNYLGTGAISNPVPTLENKDVDFEQVEEETKKLQQQIRKTKKNQREEIGDCLVIRAQIPSQIDPVGSSAIVLIIFRNLLILERNTNELLLSFILDTVEMLVLWKTSWLM